ncbi:DnaA initiator-associating protein [Hirschfeldia incana]|nr:DnaA initiator-associating protein [Hirschfeldia incana]
MTGELQETAAPCGAITEKRPSRLSGCVGVFFQLFDWNRRFAKKKLFSRKSLLPGKQASKRFGGNDKLLKSKLNLIDDENRGSFPNRGEVVEFKKHEMRPPSLVARLMGLESIPSNHRDKGNKKSKKKKPSHSDKCHLSDEEEEEEEDNGLDIKSRPQKMQRTICDRRVMVKKFGSDAMQIKNVLTRVRKHQHQGLAVPVKSPRLQRRNSRLINAAARILEPGKRNAIAYPSSSRTIRCGNVGKEPVEVDYSSSSVASCKACGSFVDVHGTSPVAEESGKNMVGVSESTPFERSKRSVFWRNQEPSVPAFSGKGRGCIDQMERKALHRARFDFNGKHVKDEMAKVRFPPSPQSYTLQSRRGSSSPANTINCKEKDFIAFSRGSTSREECSNRSGLNTCARKRRLACGSSSMSPVSRRSDGESSCGSPQREYSQCCRETKERKRPPRVPNQMGERNLRAPSQKRIQLDPGTVGLIQQKLEELTSQEEDDEALRGSALPSKPASLILHELLSSLAHEQPYPRRKGKTEMWSAIGNANSDYTSPGSVLDASFSNESCFSNSFDNISVPGQMRLPLEPVEPDWDVLVDTATLFKNSTSGGNYQAITTLVSHVSNVLKSLSNTGLISTQQRFTNAREVLIHTELLVCSTTQGNNYLIGPELFDELMIYAARSDNLLNLSGITGGFLVDAMIEHLEERNISLKPSTAEASELIQGVLEDVPKWAALARIEMDEVVSIEMEKWMVLETHLFGVGSEIACEIVMCLVGELVMDLL